MTTIGKEWAKYFGNKATTLVTLNKFTTQPVPPREFFEIWMKQPLFPEQLKAVEAIFTTDFQDINPETNELLLMFGEGCLVGETPIPLLNGQTKTIKELSESQDKEHFVYSCDDSGKIHSGKAFNVRITKYVSSVIKVTLDSGEVVTCTEGHPFLLRTGVYIKASQLTPGSPLMPLYKKCNQARWNHKVVSVECVTLSDPIPVYDMEVERYHNFAIGQGVFVHNSGKDFVAERMLIYLAYWLICLKDPQKYLGRASGTPIDLANTSVTESHASDVFFKQFCDAIRIVTNPATGHNWFEEQGMDIREGRDIMTSQVRFPKEITAYSLNSIRYTGEGKNILLGILDEIAEFKYDKARALYTNLKATATSRFPKYHKIVLISYLRDEFDFMSSRYNEVDSLPVNLRNKVYRVKKCTWEVNLNVTKEDYNDAYEADPEDSARRYENIIPSKKSQKFIKLSDSILKSIRDYTGSPIISDTPYYSEDLLQETYTPWFKPYMTKEIYELEYRAALKEVGVLPLLEAARERHSNATYYVHIDLAKGVYDYAGFCLLHTYQNTESIQGYYVDLAVQLRPKEEEIDFETIRKFIFELCAKNFPIAKVTLDGWESVDFKQQLDKKGIPCEILSVDRTMLPYNTLKDLLYQGLISFYHNPILIRELNELQINQNKVDHPKESAQRLKEESKKAGSKDIADCLAGAIHTAVSANDGIEGVIVEPKPDPEDIINSI
jgi:hypothetical protein